jgi:membrane protease YdiL (CAAX protease family)
MIGVVALVGVVAEGAAWWWVARRGASVWVVVTPVLAGLGVVALVSGTPTLAEDVAPGVAAGVGLVTGLVLYGATRAFVAVVAPRWPAFREQSVAMYGREGSLTLGVVLILSIALTVPGEELFWRGLVLPELERAVHGAGVAAVVAWAAFVVANLPSRNLAIAAGAVVGGAVWVGLASWSGGVAASLVCHAGWTGLMLVLPPLHASPEEGSP